MLFLYIEVLYYFTKKKHMQSVPSAVAITPVMAEETVLHINQGKSSPKGEKFVTLFNKLQTVLDKTPQEICQAVVDIVLEKQKLTITNFLNQFDTKKDLIDTLLNDSSDLELDESNLLLLEIYFKIMQLLPSEEQIKIISNGK